MTNAQRCGACALTLLSVLTFSARTEAQVSPQSATLNWRAPAPLSQADSASGRQLRLAGVAPRAAFDGATGVRASWIAPAASVILPGSGQALLRQQRAWGYVVAEGYLLLVAQRAGRDGNNARSRYREIAASVARKGMSTVGPWEYYESLEKNVESGAFDRIPGGDIDPETDLATFNGKQWRLARENNWQDPDVSPGTSTPEYQRALTFYQGHAAGDGFLWSWRNAGTQWELYKSTIVDANRSYQRRTNLLGIVKANHLISLIDAYVTVRVRRSGGAGLGAHLSSMLLQGPMPGETVLAPMVTGSLTLPNLRW